jgi:tetratricopeptide (TPR) repeat protein
MRRRDYAAAEEAYTAALAATDGFPVHDTRVRTALGNVVRVAAARQAAGEWPEAEGTLDPVLDAAMRGRLADFGTVAPVLARQADHDLRTGETDRAMRLYETALLLHGARDPAVVDERLEIQERLGRTYLGGGRLDDAEPLLLSAWRGLQSRHGPDSLAAARAGVAVAELRRAQGDLESADRIYSRALATQAGTIADTLEYAVNQSRLAAVRLALGRDEDALRLAGSSLGVLDAMDAHPAYLIETLDTLGTAETRLGLLAVARGHFARALTLYDGADSLLRAEYADLLLHVAELERRAGDPLEADALVERAARERAGGRLPD